MARRQQSGSGMAVYALGGVAVVLAGALWAYFSTSPAPAPRADDDQGTTKEAPSSPDAVAPQPTELAAAEEADALEAIAAVEAAERLKQKQRAEASPRARWLRLAILEGQECATRAARVHCLELLGAEGHDHPPELLRQALRTLATLRRAGGSGSAGASSSPLS